jgi:hypothetical protein
LLGKLLTPSDRLPSRWPSTPRIKMPGSRISRNAVAREPAQARRRRAHGPQLAQARHAQPRTARAQPRQDNRPGKGNDRVRNDRARGGVGRRWHRRLPIVRFKIQSVSVAQEEKHQIAVVLAGCRAEERRYCA